MIPLFFLCFSSLCRAAGVLPGLGLVGRCGLFCSASLFGALVWFAVCGCGWSVCVGVGWLVRWFCFVCVCGWLGLLGSVGVVAFLGLQLLSSLSAF